VRKLALAKVEPGMVLAQPVKNDKGIVLAGTGTEITERLIMRFENMGVSVLTVEGDDHLDPAKAAQLRQKIEIRFSLAGKHGLWLDVKNLLLDRLAEKAGDDAAG